MLTPTKIKHANRNCNCNYPCNPKPAKKKYKLLAGYTIPTNTIETQLVEISSRVQILESGDLLISNIRATDAGLYICVRANEAGTVKGEAYLGVLGKYKENPLLPELNLKFLKYFQLHVFGVYS